MIFARRSRSCPSLAALILTGSIAALLAAPPAPAATTLYWDNNGTTAGFGPATGTWDAIGSSTWNATAAGTTGPIVSTTTTTADFLNFGTGITGLAAGTISVGTVDAGNITIGLTSGAIVLAGGTVNLAAAQTTTIDNSANTISSVLTGAATSFTKAGGGSLTLTGANTYTGTTILNAGTLQVGNGTSGSLNGTSALTFGGSGTFNVAEAAGTNQGMGTLTFGAGHGDVISTYGGSGNTALTFTSLAARTAGAVANFNVSGGNGTTNKIVLGGQATGFIDKGIYFGGSNFAYYDAGSFVRAAVYGTDASFVTSGATTSLASNAATNYQITGSISAQATASFNTLKINGAFTVDQTVGTTLTLNGILKSGGGFGGMGAAATVTTGGSELTIRTATSADTFSFAQNGGSPFTTLNTGAGGITISGPGYVNMRVVATDNTGQVSISGGGTVLYSNAGPAASFGTGNINLNGGVLEAYFNGGISYPLGTLNSQIRITGGASGFSTNGSGTINFSSGEVTWGSTNFNPSVLILGATTGSGTTTFANAINLAGGTRTIRTDGTLGVTNAGVISNVVRDATGGAAGLIKTGAGMLIISGTANTYSGSTTISAGTLRANATGSLGNGSATNSVIFDGGTLQAAGAITSPSTRGMTLNSTGTIDTNGFAVSVAGNMTGVGGLVKNGTNTLTLSGTNSYAGITTVNAGTLAVTKQAALYGGTSGNWTAANINVTSGATLALNVDSIGTAGFNSTSLNTLLGNISVANSLAEGMQSGTTLALDTSTANGATFTQGNALTNSTGSFGGIISLTKLGAGTLVLNQTNTYSGATTITAGIINANSSAALGDSSITNTLIVNGSTLQAAGTITSGPARGVNLTGAVTIDTNGNPVSIAGNMIGAGTLTKTNTGDLTLSGVNANTGTTTVSGGTLTLTNALALQASALVTTGAANSVILSGVTTPTFGGLSGAADLATFISGYSSVTALTLNPQSGSVTYGGIIANNGMTLTKTGAGTQILSNTGNTYVGTTTVSGGTLQITGRLNTTTGTALTFGGSGTLDFKEAASSTQGMGALTFSAGEGSILSTAAGAASPATLTFASMAARAPGTTGNFVLVTNTSPSSGTPNKIVLGNSTNAPLNNSGSNNQGLFFGGSEYARYDTTAGYMRTVDYNSDKNAGVLILAGNRIGTIVFNDVKIGGAITGLTSAVAIANTVNMGPNSITLNSTSDVLSTNGILSSSATAVINTAGFIQGTAAGKEVVIRVDRSSDVLTVAPIIRDFNGGATASAFTKSGAGLLTLSGAQTYTGDTSINGGTLLLGTTANSPGVAASLGAGSYAGNIFIGSGALLSLRTTANQTFSGVISGDGAFSSVGNATTTLSANNTYTGTTTVAPQASGIGGNILSVDSINSVFTNAALGTVHSASSSLGAPLTVANGTITVGATGVGDGSILRHTGSGETTDRVINLAFNSGGNGQTLRVSGTGLLKFTSAFTSNGSTTVSGWLTLDGAGNGEIVRPLPALPGSAANYGLAKSGPGTWTLGGNYTANATAVSDGLLRFNGTVVTATTAMTLSSTGALGLQNGAVNALNITGPLNITGAAGANNLYFELGSTTGTSDQISVAGTTTVSTSGSAVVNISQLGGLLGRTQTTYTLIGGAGTLDATNFANFTLATNKAFGQTYTLANGGTNGDLQLTAANAAANTAAAFWKGGTNNWSAVANWNTGAATNVATGFAPDYQTNVTFATTSPVAINLTTNVLDVDFDINSLNFNGATGGVTIGGTKLLTIEGVTGVNGNGANNGITSANTSGTNSISSNIGLASSQTWTVATGGTLTVSGVISDFNNSYSLTKSGQGTLILSAANTYTGTTTVSDGTLQYGISSALSTGAATVNGATLDMGVFTGSVGAFTLTSGTLKMAAGQTSTAQLVSTGVAALGTTNTLDLTGMGTTLGLYKLASGTSLSGTFSTVTGLDSNYVLRYGTVNANELDAQRKADQTMTAPLALGRVMTNQTFTSQALGTLNNTSVAGSSGLAISLSVSGTGLTFSNIAPASGSVAPLANTTITGTIATGATTGDVTFTVSNTDANAITTASNASGTATLLNNRVITATNLVDFGRVMVNTALDGSGNLDLTSPGADDANTRITVGNGGTDSKNLGFTVSGGTPATIFNGTTSDTRTLSGGTFTNTGVRTGNVTLTHGNAEASLLTGQTVGTTVVNYSATVLNNRVITATNPVAFGRVMVNTAVGGSNNLALTSSGADTANTRITVGNGGTDSNSLGFTVSGGTPATIFNGSTSNTRTLSGGTFTGTGVQTGTVTLTNAVAGTETATGATPGTTVINYSATALNNRAITTTNPVAFGRVLVNTVVSGTNNLALTSPGADNANTRITVGNGGTDSNSLGFTVTGGTPATIFNGSTSNTRTLSGGKFTGTGVQTGTVTLTNAVAGTETATGATPGTTAVTYSATALADRSSNITVDLGNIGRRITGANLSLTGQTLSLASSGGHNLFTDVTIGGTLYNGTTTAGTLSAQNAGITGVAASGTATISVAPVNAETNFSYTPATLTGATYTANMVAARTLTAQGTVDFGRYLQNTTGSGSTAVTSTTGDHATVADVILVAGPTSIGAFSVAGSGTNFDGTNGSGSVSLSRNFGSGVVGLQSGSISLTEANSALSPEMTGGANALSVNYTATPVASRTVTDPTATPLGTFHAGGSVTVTSNAAGYSFGAGGTGAHANTEDATLSYSGAVQNGINLTGISQTITTAAGSTGTFSGTAAAAGSYSGSFSVATSREFSGAQSPLSYAYSYSTYSGQMIWSGGGGTYATAGNWTDSVSGGAQAAPGLDAGFTGVDSATFNGTGGTVDLANSAPSLNALSFANTNSYTVSTSGAGSIIFAGTAPTVTLAGTQIISAPVSLANTLTATVIGSGDSLAVSGAISGGGGLTKLGSGTLTLSGANLHSGDTAVSAGTLTLGNVNALQASTLDTGTAGSQSVTFSLAGTSTYNLGGLKGADDLAIGANTLSVGANGQTTSYSGVISGTGNLTKTGSGTLTLSGANLHTGETRIHAGTLKFDLNGSDDDSTEIIVGDEGSTGALLDVTTKTGSFNIRGGQTLKGIGRIDGPTTIEGTHAPGNSPGLQTFNGNLSYLTGSRVNLELAANASTDTTGVRGLSFDAVDLTATGGLSIQTGVTSILIFNGPGSTVDWSAPFWSLSHSWLVYDGANALTLASGAIFDTLNFSADSLGATLTGGSFAWSHSNNDVVLHYTAIPEPAALGLLLAGLPLLGLRRRRRP